MFEKVVYDYGKWHGTVRNTSYSVYEDVLCTGDVEEAIYLQQIGYAELEDCANEYKPYLFVVGGSEGTEEMLSANITEGTYPKSSPRST